MINYTDRLALLMQDVVSRVPALSFIDMADVLVFARPGRTSAEGAFATCHCLSLPPSEPGYYFWRDRRTSCITRRSEWFVTKSPVVSIGARQVKYMLSFTLPRFPDQSLDKSRKGRWYPGRNNTWIAKLDTVVHELYHIDPEHNGIRRTDRSDGTYSTHCHSHQFFEQVAAMVTEYLDTRPDPARTIFSSTTSTGSRRATEGSSARASGRFRPIPIGFSRRSRFSPHATPIPLASKCNRSEKGSSRCITRRTTSTSGSS